MAGFTINTSAPSARSSFASRTSLERVRRVHLVAAAIPELRSGLRGLAERPVERRGVLGAVGDDRDVRWPSSSSWARIAPTRPSIMSLGATTSAPASACEIAVLASSSMVRSLSTSPSRTTPQWPCERVLAQTDVGDHDQVGVGVLERPDRHLHDALGIVGAGAGLVLGGRDAEQDHGADPGRLELGRLGRPARRSRSARCPASRAPFRAPPRRRRRTGAARGGAARARSHARARAGPSCAAASACGWRESSRA